MEDEIARVRAEEDNAKFKNFKDVRPTALAKQAIKNKSTVHLTQPPTQQTVMTNALI